MTQTSSPTEFLTATSTETSRESSTEQFRAAARGLGRRRFLTVTGAAAAIAFAANLPDTAHAASPALAQELPDDPFTLGVASGDPLPDSVVLWTRLAIDPFAADSGLPAEPIGVGWEIALDADFAQGVDAGTFDAQPAFHHAVHVIADGLEPDTTYYYRFTVGEWTSPTGRTRTAPAADATPESLRFALVSCQRYDHGYWTAYADLAEQSDLAAVLHLGDYLYEYAVDSAAGDRGYTDPLPAHFNKETVTLEDYRLRYSLYHRDPDLQAAHAAHPFIVTWDDHEVDNNYANDISEESGVSPEDFLIRRAAAYRAYYENMPLRDPQVPDGPDLQLYRRLHFGQLAQLDLLDTRQYRDDQANGDGWQLPSDESEDPDRTLLGAAQERWLSDGFQESTAVWNLVPQQVVFALRRNQVEGPWPLSMDAWDGYPATRQRVLDAVEQAGVTNLVVLTGDVHVHYAFDLKEDFADADSRTVGVEFVTTSISSNGDGVERPDNWEALTGANPHLQFYDGRRGYVLLTLDEQQVRADYRTVDVVTETGGTVSTAASFVSAAGEPGLVEVE